MAIKRRGFKDSEINMGPFADIAFLLIIFFVLVTSLARPMGRLVQMPASTEVKDEKQEDSTPTIEILKEGLRYSRGNKHPEEVSIDQLQGKLFALDLASQPDDKKSVIVNLSAGVPYEPFYQVVMAISKTGGVVTLIEEEED